jgi:hypothetical protein
MKVTLLTCSLFRVSPNGFCGLSIKKEKWRSESNRLKHLEVYECIKNKIIETERDIKIDKIIDNDKDQQLILAT